MNRSRFIQGLKGDIQLSEKERRRIIRKSLQKYSWKTKCTVAYSFPLPNDLIEVDSENPLIKHYYCCCGDSEFYGKDVTNLELTKCDSFEEL